MYRVRISIIRAAYGMLTLLQKTEPPFKTPLSDLKYINAGAVHCPDGRHGYYLLKQNGSTEKWMLLEHQGSNKGNDNSVHRILLENLNIKKGLIILNQIHEHMKIRCSGFRSMCWFDDAVNSGENSLTSVQARLALGETFDVTGPHLPKLKIKSDRKRSPGVN